MQGNSNILLTQDEDEIISQKEGRRKHKRSVQTQCRKGR